MKTVTINRKFYVIFLILSAFCIPLRAVSQDKPPQLRTDNIEEIIQAMTLEEKATLLIGTRMQGYSGNVPVTGMTQLYVPGAAGTTHPIQRLGIPAIVLADGPAGLRISPEREGTKETFYCTSFPVATLLASTWNTSIVEKVGKAMGKEALEYGVDILLAPGMNIQRNPLNGRNYEYFSEDPLLTGKMAAAYVRGVQSNGVGTSIKHFAVNNQETNRIANDSKLNVKPLREIYLRGFEIAVKESNPWTIMSSYNKINGTYASESRDLLTTIARDEWGFGGIIVTDWFGGKDAPAQIRAGNDLLMPGRTEQKEAIISAVNRGELRITEVDACVRRILELIVKSHRFNGYNYSSKPDLKSNSNTAREAGAEGMVLLKNDFHTLPLDNTIKKIAAFGTTSYDFIAGGTGSGDVNEAYTVSLQEGLERAGFVLDEKICNAYGEYLSNEEKLRKERVIKPKSKYLSLPRIGEFVPGDELLAEAASTSDIAIITIGRNSGEYIDRVEEGDFLLTAEEHKMISKVTHFFHLENKRCVVVLNIGGVIETASWKNTPDAILLAWQGGQEGGNSAADILYGAVNPSGKLSMTFPVEYKDHASSANFPTAEDVEEAEIVSPISEEQRKSQNKKNIDHTDYSEGIYVGYRCFDFYKRDVSYPFGYGLSYSMFSYSKPSVRFSNGVVTIKMTVTNIGTVAGKEVVQVYVSAPEGEIIKPLKELKAFAKTSTLRPGKSERLGLTISIEYLASFDEEMSRWIAESGKYKVLIGASADDIRLEGIFFIKKEWREKANYVLSPEY